MEKGGGQRMANFDELEPVRRETTAGIIADRIRGGITAGRIGGGSQLGEADLAAQFQVSRGPVREALQRLIQEGLLEGVPNRGVFVVKLGVDDIADIYLARRAVERAAVDALLHDGAPGALRGVERVLRRMESAARNGRWAAVADFDLQFHQELVAASGSSRLDRIESTLLVETRLCMAALQRAYPIREDIVMEHRQIFDALSSRDEELVARLIGSHMDDAVKRLTHARVDEDREMIDGRGA